MMFGLLKGLLGVLLNPKVLMAIAVAVALWWVYGYIYDRGYDQAEALLMPKIVALDNEKNRADALAREADKRYREQEVMWQSTLKEKQDAYNVRQIENARFLAMAIANASKYRADSQQLRDRLSAYAAGRSSTTPDTQAAASERAVALGRLLEEAVSLTDETLSAATENTAAAESNGDAVRTVLASWPH